MTDRDHPDAPRLSEADARALDRLMESAGDPADTHDPRQERIARLLDLLATPVAAERDRPARVALTDIRSRRTVAEQGPLSAEDAAALDLWMEGAQPPSELRDRTARHEALASLATSGTSAEPASRADLIERTLNAVRQAESEHQGRMRFEDQPGEAGSRFRWADLVSIAAMLLIGASIAIPSFEAVSRSRERSACLANMQAAARAFGTYAGANADMLPMATAGFGGSWMDVGTPSRSNSANLFTLARTDHARLDDLACPSNPQALRGTPEPGAMDWRTIDELSYSYRIMPDGGLRMTIAVPSTTRVVVTADRSPATLRVARRQPIVPEENTPNHDARGQHVLRLDGSAMWADSPVVGGDNIWLPKPIENVIHEVRSRLGLIKGNEMPSSETDAFVGP
jgi:Tfp pilus assembly protein PilE